MKYQYEDQLIEFKKLDCRYRVEGEFQYLIHLSGGNEYYLNNYFKN